MARKARTTGPYKMVISRRTVDRLGVRLYDKPSAVTAETVANSYDADATLVKVKVPLDQWLATWKGPRRRRVPHDKGFEIVVEDDGHGMTPKEANAYYLKVGIDRRAQGRARSRVKRRRVMGRKGIGKLAPFGICRTLEVWSAGGKRAPYEISHFIMRYEDMVKDVESPYFPDPGAEHGKTTTSSGTRITLRDFLPHKVPDADTLHRQLARRFSLELPDFKIEVTDTTGKAEPFTVGTLPVELLEDSRIVLDRQFETEEGEKLRVKGWVAYAKQAYRNEEVAGVRIYARGKLAAVTRDFGIRSGFTGENTIRSYLVGALTADWIDEDDDLIRTDRQDILWNTPRGEAFRKWGQELIKEIGNRTRGRIREQTWEIFLSRSGFEKRLEARYRDPQIREAALRVGKVLASVMSRDDMEDKEYVESIEEMILTVAPHKFLVDTLREIDPAEAGAMDVLLALFNTARVAEVASFGQIVRERLRIIARLEALIKAGAQEEDLQELIETAPWVLDPQWTVLTSNQPLKRFRAAFEAWYLKKHGKPIVTSALRLDKKKPDFIFLHVVQGLRIVEIKKPDHPLADREFLSVLGYLDATNEFVDGNDMRGEFPEVEVVLVCDKLALGRSNLDSFKLHKNTDRDLIHKTWFQVLTDTRKVHQDFLEAGEAVTAGVGARPRSNK